MSLWNRFWRSVIATLRRDFIAGLLVFVPVGFTLLGILWLIEQLDNLVLPRVFRAIGIEGTGPRFLGVAVTLWVILLAGALTLYGVLKQFMEAVIGQANAVRSFERVVIIEYPRPGIFTYGFVTGEHPHWRTPELPENLLKVFVSSTPNPTTGYFLLVPEDQVVETDLTVEGAFRLIVSAGIAEAQSDAKPATPPLSSA